ncbi:MAG: hypothetical protein JWP12_2888 [Bacteroidetes bacterium]|nr:hypothetical protein [Bacteroidota bacterium]
MKYLIIIISIAFLFSACGNATHTIPDKVKQDTAVVYKHDTVNYSLPYACVAGLYSGDCDRGALLHCSGMMLKNNEEGYIILSFECSNVMLTDSFKKNGRIRNIGAAFNKEIIKIFGEFDSSAKFCFENIKAVGMNSDTVMLNPVIINVVGEKFE